MINEALQTNIYRKSTHNAVYYTGIFLHQEFKNFNPSL